MNGIRKKSKMDSERTSKIQARLDGLTREEFDSICEGVLMFSGEALNGLGGTGF